MGGTPTTVIRRRSAWASKDAGSALMLLPAAVLVMVVLGALVVDQAHIFLAQRQLASAAQAAATDAVSQLDSAAFYRTGAVALDPTAADRVAVGSVADQSLDGLQLEGPPMVVVVGRQVCVALTARVPAIFGRAIPGFGAPTIVTARSTATAAGDRPGPVPSRRIC